MKERVTTDEYKVQAYYGCPGWEAVTTELTYKEARQQLRRYEENEPQYAHRIAKHRVREQSDLLALAGGK